MKNTFIYIIIISFTCIIGCSSSDDGEITIPVNNLPTASSYIIPTNNQICTGTEVTPTSIQVDFEWNNFNDTEDTSLNYILKVINQSTNAIVLEQNITSNSYSTILDKGVTYSWNVTATDSNGESITGSTWQFQTPFEATSNYAPFPATMISPNNGATLTNTNVTLIWEGNDPDTDETSQLLYDVYLSDSNPPSIASSDQSTLSHTATLTQGIYYWMIISKDPNNTSSRSQINQLIID
jgi:hypothetical protein